MIALNATQVEMVIKTVNNDIFHLFAIPLYGLSSFSPLSTSFKNPKMRSCEKKGAIVQNINNRINLQNTQDIVIEI